MKKILLATTVLAAAGFTSAQAAEWETGVSGYYYLGLGLSDASDQDGLGIVRDGEIHFNGRLTADNGLTFRARVELEANTSADQIDENWGSVGGSFGTILIGSNDDAVYNNHVGVIYAPGARVGYYDEFNTVTAGAAYNRAGVGSDQIGIHYTTPDFFGFKAYGSYHPSATTSDGPGGFGVGDNNVINFEGTDLYAVGASYTGDFGDFGFAVSGGFTDVEALGQLYTFGANVSFGGFTVAGTYERENPDGGGQNGDEFAIGMQYATGPWTVGGGWGSADGDQFTGGSTNGADLGEDQITGWVTYAAAPGVLFTVGLEYADAEGGGSDFGGLGYLTLRF
ncbi:MAG: porin [Pseudomonadota bacterium]